MIGVEIHAQHMTGAQIVECGGRIGRDGPVGVQIPAAACRVEVEVVTHRPPITYPVAPLVAAVVERHWGGDVRMRTEPVHQGGRDFDP